MKDERTLKTECTTSESLRKYLEEKANNHTCYKVYTDSYSLEYLMAERALFLSDGGNWNDQKDKNQFNNPEFDTVNFGKCFCYSRSESVPMWMLYCGTDHTGVMLNFGKTLLRNMLHRMDKIEIGIWDKEKKFQKTGELQAGEYDWKLTDVIYVGKDKEGTFGKRIKRSDEICKTISQEILDEIRCIKKTYPWNYENECRLIISVKREYIIDARANSIKIPVKDLYEIMLNQGNIFAEPNYKGSNRFAKSSLDNELEWDICNGCHKNNLKSV